MYENRKQEFLDLFYNQVFPYIAQGEIKRKQYLFIIISIIILSIIGFVTISYYLVKDSSFDTATVKAIISNIMLFVLIGVVPALLLKYKFIESIKKRYMNGIVSYFNGMKWIDIETLDKNEKIQSFRQNPLFFDENITEISFDDFFTGKYNNIDYNLSETSLHDVRGSGKGRHDMKVFRGITLEMDIKNLVSDEILIFSKDMKLNKNSEATMPIIYFSCVIIFTALGIFKYQSSGDIADLIILGIVILAYAIAGIFLTVRIRKFLNKDKFNSADDLKINDRFYVKTKNIQETEKLIKPDLFGILQTISLVYKSKGVALNTYREYGNTKAMVIIPTDVNAFEIGSLLSPLNKPQSMDTFFNQLACIMDLMDYFTNLEKANQE